MLAGPNEHSSKLYWLLLLCQRQRAKSHIVVPKLLLLWCHKQVKYTCLHLALESHHRQNSYNEQVLFRTTEYQSSTTKNSAAIQSTTLVLLCTTPVLQSTTPYYKVLCQYTRSEFTPEAIQNLRPNRPPALT